MSFNTHAYEEKVPRYALVIGNGSYQSAALANSINDAQDIARSLRDLEYDVTLELDLTAANFDQVVRRFYNQIASDNAITIFYYAGHAVQLDSSNYLIPLNAEIDSKQDLEDRAFLIDKLLFYIKQSNSSQNIIVLDACRNNPFEGNAEVKAGDLRDLNDGLAAIRAPVNTLVAYATEPGEVAYDGNGRNGIYSTALLKHIDEAIPAEELFKKVRREVIEETGNQQIPWEHSSLTQKFYFGPPANQEITDIPSF